MKSLEVLGYNAGLPLRLVKRRILLDAGLPVDDSLQTFTAPDDVDAIVDAVRTDLPQYVVMSLPGPYHLPPFYSVDADGKFARRDVDELAPPSGWDAFAEELRGLPPGTLVDLVKPVWGEGVVAARFMYISSHNQHLEAGAWSLPREIGLPHAGPCMQVLLKDFLPKSVTTMGGDPPDELMAAVVELLAAMSACEKGLQRLAEVSPYPTVEMACHPTRGVIILDVDWPVQWADPARLVSEASVDGSRSAP